MWPCEIATCWRGTSARDGRPASRASRSWGSRSSDASPARDPPATRSSPQEVSSWSCRTGERVPGGLRYCQLCQAVRVYEFMASVARRELPVGQEVERELLELARRGDRDAAQTLLERHELLAFRICRRLLPAGEDLEGAVQETMLRALKNLSRFSGEGSFGGWLAAIAVNLCRDRMRRHRLIPFLPLEARDGDETDAMAVIPSSEPSPERVVMARQAVQRLHKEVSRLPRRQREVFALRFFGGLDLEGIATALRVDVGTVKTHLHRAVQRVRLAVEEARP
jgi:RNA polymerase sigma factor (sigma-70 family)